MHLRTNAPQPARGIDVEVMKASGLRNANILVVSLDDPRLSWVDKEELERIGTKLHGPRRAKGQ